MTKSQEDSYRVMFQKAHDDVNDRREAYLKATRIRLRMMNQALAEGLNQSDVASLMGVSRQRVSQIMSGNQDL